MNLRIEVIGDEIWANGFRVAKLTNEAPASVAGEFRDDIADAIEQFQEGGCNRDDCPLAA